MLEVYTYIFFNEKSKGAVAVDVLYVAGTIR